MIVYPEKLLNLISMSKEVKLNIEELKDFLSYIITNNRKIQGEGKIPVAVNIEGDSGIGKTSAIIQLANELELDHIKLNLSQLEELGDLVGYPTKEHEMIKTTAETTETRWVPESVMAKYIENRFVPTGQKRMTHAIPDWIQGKESGGILILDDYTRADLRFIQAVMELIDRQSYMSWKLPKDWHIVLTTNPDNGSYTVTSLDEAQKTRFITASLKFDIQTWARWAEKTGIDGRCINFMLLHPELSDKKSQVNARSFTTFFNSISSIPKFEDDLPMIQMVGEGSVGVEFASLFTTFIQNKLDKLITPEEIISKPWSYVERELKDIIGQDSYYRADIAGVMTIRLTNYSLYYAENNKITDDFAKRLILLGTEDIFTNDLKYYMVRTIHAGNRTKFKALLMDTELAQVITR